MRFNYTFLLFILGLGYMVIGEHLSHTAWVVFSIIVGGATITFALAFILLGVR